MKKETQKKDEEKSVESLTYGNPKAKKKAEQREYNFESRIKAYRLKI